MKLSGANSSLNMPSARQFTSSPQDWDMYPTPLLTHNWLLWSSLSAPMMDGWNSLGPTASVNQFTSSPQDWNMYSTPLLTHNWLLRSSLIWRSKLLYGASWGEVNIYLFTQYQYQYLYSISRETKGMLPLQSSTLNQGVYHSCLQEHQGLVKLHHQKSQRLHSSNSACRMLHGRLFTARSYC